MNSEEPIETHISVKLEPITEIEQAEILSSHKFTSYQDLDNHNEIIEDECVPEVPPSNDNNILTFGMQGAAPAEESGSLVNLGHS